MTVQGRIYGQGMTAVNALVTLTDDTGGSQQIAIAAGEQYTITGDETVIRSMKVTFSAPGYADLNTTVADLIDYGSTVELVKGSNNLIIAAAVVGTGLLLAGKKRKSVGSLPALALASKIPTWVWVGGGALVYFGVVRPLLIKLGVLDSLETKALDTISSDPNSWWYPGFYKTKPYNVSYTRPITKGKANELAEYLYDQFGWFNDGEDAAKAVFKQLPSQSAGSFVSESFSEIYGLDMLSFLRGGLWPQDRLSDEDVFEIDGYVRSLPKY